MERGVDKGEGTGNYVHVGPIDDLAGSPRGSLH